MRLPDDLPPRVSVRRVSVIVADEISGNVRVGVDVRLAVGNQLLHVNDAVQRNGAVRGDIRSDVAVQQFIRRLGIIGRRGDGNLVRHVLRQAQPKIVALHFVVARAGRGGRAGLDQRQQPARRISGNDIRIARILHRVHKHARERLAVCAGTFTAPGKTHAGLRHQIALVSRVNKFLCAVNRAVLHGDLRDDQIRHRHRGELLIGKNRNARAVEHLQKNLLRDVRLEPINRIRRAVGRADARVKFRRETTDGIWKHAHIRHAQAARSHAADVVVEHHERNIFAQPRRRDRRNRAAGRAAVNANVGSHYSGRSEKNFCRNQKSKSSGDKFFE